MAPDDKDTLTLYQRALGPRFDVLPAVLHQFHGNQRGGTAAGAVSIIRGDGVVRNLAAELLRLPRAGKDVAITVEIRVDGVGETWCRCFGGCRLITRQWLDRSFIVEQAGPLRLWFHVEASSIGMRFDSMRCTLFGILMPNPMAFRVAAVVTGMAESWWVDVEIFAPMLGSLVRYEGEVFPN